MDRCRHCGCRHQRFGRTREPSWGIVVIVIIVDVPLVAVMMLAIVNVNELAEWCSCRYRRAGW